MLADDLNRLELFMLHNFFYEFACDVSGLANTANILTFCRIRFYNQLEIRLGALSITYLVVQLSLVIVTDCIIPIFNSSQFRIETSLIICNTYKSTLSEPGYRRAITKLEVFEKLFIYYSIVLSVITTGLGDTKFINFLMSSR